MYRDVEFKIIGDVLTSFQGRNVVIDDENSNFTKRDSYVSLVRKKVYVFALSSIYLWCYIL